MSNEAGVGAGGSEPSDPFKITKLAVHLRFAYNDELAPASPRALAAALQVSVGEVRSALAELRAERVPEALAFAAEVEQARQAISDDLERARQAITDDTSHQDGWLGTVRDVAARHGLSPASVEEAADLEADAGRLLVSPELSSRELADQTAQARMKLLGLGMEPRDGASDPEPRTVGPLSQQIGVNPEAVHAALTEFRQEGLDWRRPPDGDGANGPVRGGGGGHERLTGEKAPSARELDQMLWPAADTPGRADGHDRREGRDGRPDDGVLGGPGRDGPRYGPYQKIVRDRLEAQTRANDGTPHETSEVRNDQRPAGSQDSGRRSDGGSPETGARSETRNNRGNHRPGG